MDDIADTDDAKGHLGALFNDQTKCYGEEPFAKPDLLWWGNIRKWETGGPTDVMNQLCRVCGEPAAGFHFGAFTCEGCKSFFGRTYNNLSTIQECKNNGQCVINKKNRTSCKACRLRKCLMVGMSKSGSRYGRRSNWFKIHCLLQEQNQGQSGGVFGEGLDKVVKGPWNGVSKKTVLQHHPSEMFDDKGLGGGASVSCVPLPMSGGSPVDKHAQGARSANNTITSGGNHNNNFLVRNLSYSAEASLWAARNSLLPLQVPPDLSALPPVPLSPFLPNPFMGFGVQNPRNLLLPYMAAAATHQRPQPASFPRLSSSSSSSSSCEQRDCHSEPPVLRELPKPGPPSPIPMLGPVQDKPMDLSVKGLQEQANQALEFSDDEDADSEEELKGKEDDSSSESLEEEVASRETKPTTPLDLTTKT